MPVTSPPLRVVLAKVGLDGHDRGIKVVARALRDAGMEVIYAGLWQTPEAVVRTVADEDAGWLGLSLLSGAHLTLVPRVMQLLREAKLDHKPPVGTVAAVLENNTPAVILSDGPIRPGIDPATGGRRRAVARPRWRFRDGHRCTSSFDRSDGGGRPSQAPRRPA